MLPAPIRDDAAWPAAAIYESRLRRRHLKCTAGLEGEEDAFLAFNAGFGKFDLHAEFGWERHERGEDTMTH